MSAEYKKMTDFPLEMRRDRFHQVVQANVENVGPMGGMLLTELGKQMALRPIMAHTVLERNAFNETHIEPISRRIAEEIEYDKELGRAFEAVVWWDAELFPFEIV